MNNPLVSIIVPVYNNRAFFGQCIDSIKNQIYKNIECIVVDDGSDGEYADHYDTFKDNYIKIFHKAGGACRQLEILA